jgi:phage terminase small subunit
MRTEKQEIFIEQYCLHGCAAKAAQIAGYSHPKQRGYELKNQFAREIEDRTRKILDRAGLKPTEKIKQEVSHVEEKSTEELQRELEALVGPLN